MPLGSLQLSLAVTPLNTFGTAAWQLPSALASGTAEQLTVGTVVSVTVKVVVQVALLPASSVAVAVIVCTPNPTSVPAAGDWTRVMPLVPLQLSLAVGGAEQLTVGTVASVTVKVVVQVALLPAPSVAVTVMVCAPRPTSFSSMGH